MQRSATSTHAGGLFSKFGGTKTPTSTRPTTSSESTATHLESTPSHTASRTSTFGRATSFSSHSKSQRSRNNSIPRIAVPSLSPEKRAHSATRYTDSSPLPVGVPSRQDTEALPKSADSIRQIAAGAEAVQAATTRPASVAESFTSTTPYSNMLVRGTTNPAMGYNGPMPITTPLAPASPTLENITYQHIQETSSKRISTLDYLRKAYDSPASLCYPYSDGCLDTKEEYTGSIHYYSTNQIYNECHTLIPGNSPGARPIISY